LFEAAHGGTLFLDEIGELPEPLQVKLLRVLQEGEVRRVGATQTRRVDARIVAATNRSLEKDVEEGRFRGDLYYRVAVVTLNLPALRDRPQDVPLLIQHLLSIHAERLDVAAHEIDRPAMEALLSYSWPGNVRELENVLERALVLAEGPEITLADLPDHLRDAGSEPLIPAGSSPLGEDEDLSVKRRSAALEKQLIRKALSRTGGHRGKAAEMLELSDRALRYKIQEYALEEG
jgi:two-component system response regulator AtoC